MIILAQKTFNIGVKNYANVYINNYSTNSKQNLFFHRSVKLSGVGKLKYTSGQTGSKLDQF